MIINKTFLEIFTFFRYRKIDIYKIYEYMKIWNILNESKKYTLYVNIQFYINKYPDLNSS